MATGRRRAFFINLALNVGAYEGLGYGESVGAMIHNEGLTIPAVEQLMASVRDDLASNPGAGRCRRRPAGCQAAVRNLVRVGCPISHGWKQYSVQAGAYKMGIPFTGHPMIGHDIIYNHPMNHCACFRAYRRARFSNLRGKREPAGRWRLHFDWICCDESDGL